MTHSSPWLSRGPNRNRWFTVLKNGWIFPWQTVNVITRCYIWLDIFGLQNQLEPTDLVPLWSTGMPNINIWDWWWLEPWNFEWLSIYWYIGKNNHPNWRTHIFKRDWHHQIDWEFHHPKWRTHIFRRGGEKPPTRYPNDQSLNASTGIAFSR